jgi:hypothetical protein
MAAMPSGREIYSLKAYVPPVLEPSVLEGMRAPPDRVEDYGSESSDEDGEEGNEPVGAFPGTKQDYGSESSRNYY